MDQPIHVAAREGNLAEVNQLLQEDGGRLEARDTINGTPLMHAALKGRDGVVARLLALGADVGLTSDSGETAVHLACAEDHSSVLALLLNAGASFNARLSMDQPCWWWPPSTEPLPA